MSINHVTTLAKSEASPDLGGSRKAVHSFPVSPGENAEQETALIHFESHGDDQSAYLVGSDPIVEAETVIYRLQESTGAVVKACVITLNALEKFKGQPEAIKSFLGVLVEGGVLTSLDGEKPDESSKLSKFRKIGRHADLLLGPDVLPLLPSGFSLIYEAIRLYEALNRDKAEWVKILAGFDKDPRRQDIINKTRGVALKSAVQPRERSLQNGKPMDTGALQEAQFCMKPDLILFTPAADDLRRLKINYMEGSLPFCMRLADVVADDACAIVIARFADLPKIVERMLRASGFELERVFLTSKTDTPDITDRKVVIAAIRGQGRIAALDGDGWFVDLDPGAIAEQLVPDCEHKMHLFADKQMDDWERVGSDAAWAQTSNLNPS